METVREPQAGDWQALCRCFLLLWKGGVVRGVVDIAGVCGGFMTMESSQSVYSIVFMTIVSL